MNNNSIHLVAFEALKDNAALKAEYLTWLNDARVITSINSYELLQKKDLSFIEESFQRFASTTCKGYFIYVKQDQKYIGTVKLDKIDTFKKSAEVGIMIGDVNYYGKGFGYKSLELLLKYAFLDLELHRIWGGTDEHNISMIRIFEKLNFIKEGIFREANFINNEYSDNILYSILSHEYFLKR